MILYFIPGKYRFGNQNGADLVHGYVKVQEFP